jgi:pimeloyl-ACP methyl ester carboxylesterase
VIDAHQRNMQLRLADGRTLGFTEYGDPAGTPVFLFHGTPGSRLTFLDDDPVACELGVRLVTPDRPGFGLSDFQPGRTLLDWGKDVAALADHLGLDRFAVAGASGGGPHTAACAHALPERVTAAALVASAAPLEAPDAMHGMTWSNRIGFTLPRYAPWLLRGLVSLQARSIRRSPDAFLRSMLQQLCESDREVLSTEAQQQTVVMHLQEAVRRGSRGTAYEVALMSRPWGFDPGEIRVPVHLWHGEEDTLAPVSMGRYLAATIPGCRAHFLPGIGHMVAEHESHWREILGTLTGRSD